MAAEKSVGIRITNQEFLEGLAGDKWGEVPVSSGEKSWAVKPAKLMMAVCLPDTPNYYTVSFFHREPNGPLSRKIEKFIRQFVFAIDDIGTKLREEPLRLLLPPPTYELETSPGNFHWGYKLDVEGSDDARVLRALFYAVVDNPNINTQPGIDPGMAGVNSVMRLPVGANCKEAVRAKNGGKPWRHILHVWEPGRSYRARDLAAGLGVDLSDESLDRHRTNRLSTKRATSADLAADDVLRVFERKGMIVNGRLSDSGWIDVVCPWAHEHTSKGDTAGYRPGGGGFQCHHGHCAHRTMTDVRAWIAEECKDERVETLGELFDEAGGATVANDPALYQAIAARDEVAATVERRKRMVFKAVSAEWVWMPWCDKFGRRSDGRLYSEKGFNSLNQALAPFGSTGQKSAAALYINDPACVIADEVTYFPGQPEIFEEPVKGRVKTVFNTWRSGKPFDEDELPFPPDPEDARPWLDHVDYLFPDPVAKKWLLDWAAFMIQYPGEKVHWAFLLTGGQGCGKDLLLRPLQNLLGIANWKAVQVSDLQGNGANYQDWAASQLCIVEELPSFEKINVYDNLKRYISGAPFIRVAGKFERHYNIRNLQLWFLFSNHEDAMALEDDDRRYFVYRTPAERKSDDYYQTLGDTFSTIKFLAGVEAWLMLRDLSAFNPGAKPPMTDDKRAMISAARSTLDAWVDDEMSEGGNLFGRKVVALTEVVGWLQSIVFAGESALGIKPTSIAKALRKRGWREVGRPRIDGRKIRMYAKSRLLHDKPEGFIRDVWQKDYAKAQSGSDTKATDPF